MGFELIDLAKNSLARAKQLGADSAEVYLLRNRSMEVEVCNDRLDEIKQSESQGIGLRILKGNRQGFAFTSDLRETAVDRMMQQALANCNYNDRDDSLYFPQCLRTVYPKLNLYDKTIKERSLDEKVELARETTRYALDYSDRVKRVERSGYEEGEVEIWLANSNDTILWQNGSYCGLYSLAVGEADDDRQSGYGMDSGIGLADISPERAGRMAGRRAVQMLGSTQIGSGRMDLILDPLIAVQILGIISSCFSGEAVRKQKSFLAGKLGQTVGSSLLTLVDDGTLEGRLGSAVFDGEGIPTQRTVLLQNGVLQNYLYDCASAAKAGTVSTGNGMRGSYKGTPHVGTTNYYLEAGDATPEQLIGGVTRGLYITEIMGAHTANPVSGDFSFGASGILIEYGQLTRPVRGITIAGNLQQLLQQISGVGSDLTFYGSSGAPTVRIADIAVSGT